jgi:hypothetical protein
LPEAFCEGPDIFYFYAANIMTNIIINKVMYALACTISGIMLNSGAPERIPEHEPVTRRASAGKFMYPTNPGAFSDMYRRQMGCAPSAHKKAL